jgi:hypothetical protein
MERAVAFTVMPGWGGVLMGLVAFFTAAIASRMEDPLSWLITWLGAAALAVLIGLSDMAQKARADHASRWRAAGWRFAMALAPPLVAGAFLTFVLFRAGEAVLLPGFWLLIYGVAVTGASPFSIRAVRWMGLAFMLIGGAALVSPPAWGDAFMAAGFGAIHVVFGLWIARHDHD